MPPETPVPGSPGDWLRHARSDLALAQQTPASYVLLAALCFHAQQATEKSIKAVLVAKDIDFPRTHNLARLIRVLEENQVAFPKDLNEAATLTAYAVVSRYPGLQSEIEQEDVAEARRLAEAVFAWAREVVETPSG